MLCGFLDQRKHNQTEELVRDTSFDNILDANDKEDRKHGHNGKRQHNGDNAFRERKFWLRNVLVVIKIGVLICFQHLIEDGVLRASIVEDEAGCC